MEWELQVGGVVDLEDVLSLARRVGVELSRRVAQSYAKTPCFCEF